MNEAQRRIGKLKKALEAKGPSVRVSVPLLLRLMEYGREMAKEDLDLHKVVERAAALSSNGGCLTSADYPKLVPQDKMNK